MSTTTHELTAEARDQLGTRHSHHLRSAGRLPVVMYGHKKGTVHLSLDAKEAIAHIVDGEKIFTIRIPGADPETVLLKDVHYDHIGRRIIHADFERVNLDEVVMVNIPLNLTGAAVGLKSAGAMLIHSATAITIECRVRDLRDSLDVDISGVDLNESLHAGRIDLPVGWRLVSDHDVVVAAIQMKKQEAVGEEVEAEAGAAEPEVGSDKEESKEEESKE